MTEYMMEQIAYEIDKDPIQVRLANFDRTYTDVLDVVQTLLRDSEYDKRRQEVDEFNRLNRWKKRGLRVAMMNWPVATVLDYHVMMSVYHGDGTVAVRHGGIEVGQGINTKVAQAIAYTLNISVNKVRCKPVEVSAILTTLPPEAVELHKQSLSVLSSAANYC
ncbi:xanthine dehydrogenase-like [Manduca sexta]|uniref:xanthine dehydrogenase-like n=1 Tax=Manduca sexta TaxID=7130 RepID=UPI00188F18F0|nr:xanthine dehydrogenase-like [Manduca sexta]